MTNCTIRRIINLKNPIRYQTVNILSDDTGEDVDVTDGVSFSWSSDGACWSPWTGAATYNQICKNIDSDFYLRFLVSNINIQIYRDEKRVLDTCWSACLYNEDQFTKSLITDNTPNIYSTLDCALNLQNQINDTIINFLGIAIYYFRVSPDMSSKDLTFKEFALHNVVDVKTIKLLAPDGNMPSSKPQMTEFDFDWVNDWDVEVSKTSFAQAFGDTVFPKQRDLVYIPMMKRMYEVNSAYDEKKDGLMWHSSTWHLALVKYTDKTNVDKGEFEDTIDSLLTNKYTEMMWPGEQKEQAAASGVVQVQAPQYAASNLINVLDTDAIRGLISAGEQDSIYKLELKHNSLVVTHNVYKFKDDDSEIVYQKKWCSDDGTLMFLIRLAAGAASGSGILLALGQNITVNVEGTDTGFRLKFGDLSVSLSYNIYYNIIVKWNRRNFTTSITAYPLVDATTDPSLTDEQRARNAKLPLYVRVNLGSRFDFEHGTTVVGKYNNNYITTSEKDIILGPYPFDMTNIKLYTTELSAEDTLKESLKYITDNTCCLFNDCCRPLTGAHGYNSNMASS